MAEPSIIVSESSQDVHTAPYPTNFPRRVLIQTECFKNRILSFFTSPVLTTRVIIYFVNTLNSLGNYIFVNIYYIPIFRILRGEIHLRRF